MILNEKGILKEFDLVIYPVQLVFALGDFEKEINQRYKPYDEHFNYIGFPKNNPAATFNIKVKKTGDVACMIWIPNTNEVKGSYISHEADHVALEIFKYIGAHIDYDDQEPFCYLLGTVFRLINGAFYELRDYKSNKVKKKAK